MKIQEVMTRSVFTCSRDNTLEQAAREMWERDVGCLVVTDDFGRPIGMLTDRDMLMAVYTQGKALRDARVEGAMAKSVLMCTPEAPIGEVETLMQRAKIRRVPVVGADERVVGIVTLGDLARDAESGAKRLAAIPGVAKTLAAITERRARESSAAAE